MSVGLLSAVAEKNKDFPRGENWPQKSSAVYLTRDDIERLTASGTQCRIVKLASGDELFGDADEAVIIETPAKTPARRTRGLLQGITAATVIGASAGISVACTLMIMTQKAPEGVVAIIKRAVTLFV